MFTTDTNFDTEITLETESVPIDEELPFRVLLMGDWSGREKRQTIPDSVSLRPIEIDRDNFEDVMKRLRVGVDLDFPGTTENSISLEFNELDDFHPDKIFHSLSLFANLRDVRRKLVNSNTFNEAATEVRSWLVNDGKTDKIENSSLSSELNRPAVGNLLDHILGQSENVSYSMQSPNDTSSELSSFISKIVKPHLIQTDTEEQSKLLLVVDEVISDLMREILHHPRFQALESAWRGAFLLAKNIETSSSLKLFLFDIEKSALADKLKSVNDLAATDVYQTLNEFDEPWSVICGNYSFELNVDDTATLIRLAKISSHLNAPFISHIKPAAFGFTAFESVSFIDNWNIADDTTEYKLWDALRSLPEASYIGLALPRFLARLPYGEKTEPTENFYFEEFTLLVEHENFLWANPTFVCGLMLAQTFQESGWAFAGNLKQDIDNLPAYYYQEDGETKIKPCAEIIMTQSNCEKIINRGLIPLISSRDTNRIRVSRFQSITFAESMLSGRWNHKQAR